MAKKVKHEEEPAAGKSETVLEAAAQDGAAPQAETLVEGDGGKAAESTGAEHQGEPPPAADGSADGRQDAGEQIKDEAATGETAGEEIAGLGASGDDDQADGRSELEELAESERFSGSDIDAGHGRSTERSRGYDDLRDGSVSGQGNDSDVTLDPDGNPPSTDAPPAGVNDSDGSADARTLGRFEQLANEDPNFYAAVEALDEIAERGIRIAFPGHDDKRLWEIQHIEDIGGWLDGDAFVDAAHLIRKIGDRATPEVIGQEMHLKGHRQPGPLKAVERLIIGAFQHNLLALDQFAKAEADAIAAAEAERNKPKPPTTPLEDTMLEPTPGPHDTVY